MNQPTNPFPTPKIPWALLNELTASWQDLLAVLSPLMTEKMLQSIASADYGYQKEECLCYLKAIVKNQKVPTQVAFILTECLELTRWTLSTEKEEYLCRAFSCCLLLILDQQSNYTPISDENETLAILIESITTLNLAPKLAQNLIVWRLLMDYKEEEAWYIEEQDDVSEITLSPFFIYGLLLLMVFNEEPPAAVEQVLDWSIAMHLESTNSIFFDKEKEHIFLLGTTNFNQREAVWKYLSQQMKEWSTYITIGVVRDKLDQVIKDICQ
ncbi:MAG: hypothetical protein ACRBFS_02515 [Aureispira sp.]